MANIDDQHYINLVINGDTNAFAVLADQYKGMVFSLTLKMLKNREEAEEAAQDSFIKVYRSLAKYKGESKFSTWLYTITYNTCLDRIRKNKRAQHVVAIDDYTEQQVTSLDNALDGMEAKERTQLIQDCLNLLPGEDSFLLTLFYFEEESAKEIAKIMGTNANHIKIKLYRSRKKLAAVVKTHLETEMTEHYESEQR
ncbi:MAG: sigma-70 family RNA polymerase sigma factor [Ferruginibacter sp.]